jgi:hypothetical protein
VQRPRLYPTIIATVFRAQPSVITRIVETYGQKLWRNRRALVPRHRGRRRRRGGFARSLPSSRLVDADSASSSESRATGRVRRAFQLAILRMVDHSQAANPTAGRAGQSRAYRSGNWLYKTRQIVTGRNKHPRRRRSEQDRMLRRPNRRYDPGQFPRSLQPCAPQNPSAGEYVETGVRHERQDSKCYRTRLVAASPCVRVRRAFRLAILRMVDHSGNPTAGRAGQSRTYRSGRGYCPADDWCKIVIRSLITEI